MGNAKHHQVLQEKLGELEDRLRHVKKDVTKAVSSDFAEQATERENDEVLEEIARETEMSIRDIQLALRRLEGENYGLCRSCGGAIEDARLHILPSTTLCAECAEYS